MSDDIPKEVEDALSEPEEKAPKSKNKLFIIIGAVVFLAGVQVFVMKFVFSSSPDDESGTAEVAQEVEEDTEAEVNIDSFNCTNRSALPGSDIHVSFDLFALVPRTLKDSFETDYKDVHKNRVKQAVEEVIRGATLEELDDSDKKALKRKMKEDINKVMNRTYVSELVILGFRTL